MFFTSLQSILPFENNDNEKLSILKIIDFLRIIADKIC